MSPSELAVRALRKLKVIGATETASAEDLAVAVQAVNDAHSILSTQGLLRWTLNDIPKEVELGYVQMAAYIASDEFIQPKDVGWMATGLALVQAHVYLPHESSAAVDF